MTRWWKRGRSVGQGLWLITVGPPPAAATNYPPLAVLEKIKNLNVNTNRHSHAGGNPGNPVRSDTLIIEKYRFWIPDCSGMTRFGRDESRRIYAIV
jgi:hypothetical protein